MEQHFENGIPIEEVHFTVANLPEGKTFDDLDVNTRELIRSVAMQKRIAEIMGNRVGLFVAKHLSLYDTLDEAVKVHNQIPIVGRIYIPPGMQVEQPKGMALHYIIPEPDSE